MGLILEVKTIKGTVIQKLSEALKELVPDINLIFTRKVETIDENGKKQVTGGIRAVTMAMANNVLMHLKLNAGDFDTYVCNKDKVTIGLNTNVLFKVMKMLNNSDTLTLFVDEEDQNKLGIKFTNAEKKVTSTKRISLMDIDEYNIEIPPTKFSTYVNMPSAFFNKICKDLNSIASKVDIERVKEKLIFKATGEEVSDEVFIEKSDNCVTIFTEEKYLNTIFKGSYDLKYLSVFTKCTSLCSHVEIYIKNDYPLLIKYHVASLGKIYFCLSSKSNSDKLKYESISESDSDESDDESE